MSDSRLAVSLDDIGIGRDRFYRGTWFLVQVGLHQFQHDVGPCAECDIITVNIHFQRDIVPLAILEDAFELEGSYDIVGGIAGNIVEYVRKQFVDLDGRKLTPFRVWVRPACKIRNK